MNRQYLQTQIRDITVSRDRLVWLEAYLTQAEKVANFGCDLGSETLALMWLLDAREAVGLDIDASDIREAEDRLHGLQGEIVQAHRTVDYPWIPEKDRVWWAEAPDFFTQRIFEDSFSLSYEEHDITKPTGLVLCKPSY